MRLVPAIFNLRCPEIKNHYVVGRLWITDEVLDQWVIIGAVTKIRIVKRFVERLGLECKVGRVQ